MNSNIPHYVVIGGGLGGLVTAYFISLVKPLGTFRLSVIEASNRWGGLIHSVKSPESGSVYEWGPHTARSNSKTSSLLIRMVQDLDLRNRMIGIAHNLSCQYIYLNGKHIPVSMFSMKTHKPFTRSPLNLFIRKAFATPPKYQSDLTVDEFLRSRFDEEFADYFGTAMIRGICAGDSTKLSVHSYLKNLVELEKSAPNLALGIIKSFFKKSIDSVQIPTIVDKLLPPADSHLLSTTRAWSLFDGMQSLITSLIDRLQTKTPFVELYLNSEVKHFDFGSNGKKVEVGWELCREDMSNFITQQADAIFFACPSYVTANFLKDYLPNRTLTRFDHNNIPWTSVMSVIVELSVPNNPPVKAFGHLVPSVEDSHVLGVIYDSEILPQLDSPTSDYKRYTFLMKPNDRWLDGNYSKERINKEIEPIIYDVIRKHLKIANPNVVHFQSVLLRNSLPQYPPGHLSNLECLRNEINDQVVAKQTPNFHLVGSSYDGVGMGDVVYSALKAVTSEFKLV